MPKLHGWRDRQPFNNYDALFVGVEHAENLNVEERLFVQAMRPDDWSWTNLLHGGQLEGSHDSTSIIHSWYARTNIPACAELDVFANATLLTLQVGMAPIRHMSLYDLLRRNETSVLPGPLTPMQVQADHEGQVEYVARQLQFDSATRQVSHRRWDDESPETRTELRAIAQSTVNAMRVLGVRDRPVIVPVRQNIGIRVDMFARDSLHKAIRQWWGTTTSGAQLGGAPGLWVHLAGLSSRELA